MTSSVEMNPQKETASEAPLVAVSEEAAADAKSKLCKKDKNLASTSLEAHQAMFSLSDISMFFLILQSMLCLSLLSALFALAFMQKFLSLGTECLEFWKAGDESKGKCFIFFLIEYIYYPYCFCISMDMSAQYCSFLGQCSKPFKCLGN
jgi:hypothetical protein